MAENRGKVVVRKSVVELYDGQVPEMRREGYTLQQIGDFTGVTRERIRQILNKYFEGTVPQSVREHRVAKLLQCSSSTLKTMRGKGLIHPKRRGRFYIYDQANLGEALLALYKTCKICGNPIKLPKVLYCSKCGKEKQRYAYQFMTPEQKKKQRESTTRWVKEHPEKVKIISKKAMTKYQEKQKTEHWSRKPRYLVCRGEHKGTVIVGARMEGGYFISDSGVRIPALNLRRVKE